MPQPAVLDLQQAMFDLTPVSLWLEDYSQLKALFAKWRAAGIADLRALFREQPARVKDCAAAIRLEPGAERRFRCGVEVTCA